MTTLPEPCTPSRLTVSSCLVSRTTLILRRVCGRVFSLAPIARMIASDSGAAKRTFQRARTLMLTTGRQHGKIDDLLEIEIRRHRPLLAQNIEVAAGDFGIELAVLVQQMDQGRVGILRLLRIHFELVDD